MIEPPPFPGETPKAHTAYLEYCALGEDRTLAKVATIIATRQHRTESTLLGQLKSWSAKYEWVRRAAEYDQAVLLRDTELRHKRMIRRELAREERRHEMDDQHEVIARGVLTKALRQIDALIDIGKFGSQATVMLLKTALDLHRTALGAPTEVTEQQVVAQAPKLTVDELYTVLAELEQIEPPPTGGRADGQAIPDGPDAPLGAG